MSGTGGKIADHRTYRVTIRLTEIEGELLDQMAAANGLAKSSFIRAAVLWFLRRQEERER